MSQAAAGVEEVGKEEDEQVVTPWVAHAAAGDKGIDYEKLISKNIDLPLVLWYCVIISSHANAS